MFYRDSDEYHLVGKIKDAHGIRGELYVLLFSSSADWLEDLETIYLEKENPQKSEDQVQLIPDVIRPHKDGFILGSESIKTRNEAELLKGMLFYIPKELLVADAGERPYLIELQGFKVMDARDQLLGEIEGFSSNGVQDLLVIRNSRGVFEVPFVEAFICAIDYQQKQIVMDLPEGLVLL